MFCDVMVVCVRGCAVGAGDNRYAVDGQARAINVHMVVRLRAVNVQQGLAGQHVHRIVGAERLGGISRIGGHMSNSKRAGMVGACLTDQK